LRNGFYDYIPVEGQLRTMAIDNPNVYIVAVFACCRQIYNPEKDCGMMEIVPKDQRFYASPEAIEEAEKAAIAESDADPELKKEREEEEAARKAFQEI
jgi:hypothetical protein